MSSKHILSLTISTAGLFLFTLTSAIAGEYNSKDFFRAHDATAAFIAQQMFDPRLQFPRETMLPGQAFRGSIVDFDLLADAYTYEQQHGSGGLFGEWYLLTSRRFMFGLNMDIERRVVYPRITFTTSLWKKPAITISPLSLSEAVQLYIPFNDIPFIESSF